MKITKKIIAIGCLVLAVAAALLVYNFVFTPKQEEIETVQAETKKLEERESELRSHFLSLQRYRKGMETEREKQNIILSHFPQTICAEDEILFINNFETSHDIFFKALSYGSLSPFAEFTDESIATHLTAEQLILNGQYDGTYQGLKDIINHVNSQNERMIINNISASYDTTTGLLSGSIDITMFAVKGSDNIYTSPIINENVPTGRNNIFGTME